MHALLTQVDVPPHTVPQPPQLNLSVPVLTQPPAQFVSAPVHMPAHRPMLQTSVPPAGGGGQATPHAPQLARFACKLTHWPLHIVWPAGQAQAPFTHCAPPLHVVPQAPQLALSVCRFTQAFMQFVSGGPTVVAHVCVHLPFKQVGVAPPHATPQAPQLAGLVLRLVQTPLQDVSGEQLGASLLTSRAASLTSAVASATATSFALPPPSADASSGDVESKRLAPSTASTISSSVRPHPAGSTADATQRENALKRKKLRTVFITPHPPTPRSRPHNVAPPRCDKSRKSRWKSLLYLRAGWPPMPGRGTSRARRSTSVDTLGPAP